MLALKSVAKSYGGVSVLEGASLQVNPKDCLCVIGPAGSGKSTIFRLFLRLEKPTKGTVLVDGIDLSVVPSPILQLYRRRIGIVFQESVLLSHATVAENLALPLELMNAPQAVIRRNTDDLLKRLGLSGKSTRFPDELSASERSLLCIARAIITAPMVLLLDEPLANLDASQQKTVTTLVLAMHKRGTTVVIFSRDAETARMFGARTVELKNGSISASVARKAASKGGEHRIFEQEHAAASARTNDVPETAASSGKRKIRITSLHSDSDNSH